MISYSDEEDIEEICNSVSREFQTLPGMISYSDPLDSWQIGDSKVALFQTLPGMISYSDLSGADPGNHWLQPGFKPFQGWFPILTIILLFVLPSAVFWFQTLPGMISYSDLLIELMGKLGAKWSFKPFQGWFPILTMTPSRGPGLHPALVSNPSRDDFLFWPLGKRPRSLIPMAKFQTLPGMISYSDSRFSRLICMLERYVSNPSRDDFLFWPGKWRDVSKRLSASFKPFQGWFPILTTGMVAVNRYSEIGFKPFQGWFPILTCYSWFCCFCTFCWFQTLPGMISYSDNKVF